MKKNITFYLFLVFFFTGSIAAADRVSVSVPVANIRSGPGETYDLLWKVEKYHPLEIMKTSGSWYRFRDFEGDEGWIHKSLVSKTPSVITKKKNAMCDQSRIQKVIFYLPLKKESLLK